MKMMWLRQGLLLLLTWLGLYLAYGLAALLALRDRLRRRNLHLK